MEFETARTANLANGIAALALLMLSACGSPESPASGQQAAADRVLTNGKILTVDYDIKPQLTMVGGRDVFVDEAAFAQ